VDNVRADRRTKSAGGCEAPWWAPANHSKVEPLTGFWGMPYSPRKPVQTPLCIRPDFVGPVEFDGHRQRLHLIQQIKEWPCGGCCASPCWWVVCHLCMIATADVVCEPRFRHSGR
jgi:hypothetical protein